MEDIKDPSGTLSDEKMHYPTEKYTERKRQHIRHAEEIINERGSITIEMNQNDTERKQI